MLKLNPAFFEAQKAGNTPIFLCMLDSTAIRRIFSLGKATDTERGGSGNLSIYNGEKTYGDNGYYGSLYGFYGGFGPRVLDFGILLETLSPNAKDLISSLTSNQIDSYRITFDNADGYFSDILQSESFLGQRIAIVCGFLGMAFANFVSLFTGQVIEEQIDNLKLTLTAQSNLIASKLSKQSNVVSYYWLTGTTSDTYAILEGISYATFAPIFGGGVTTTWRLQIQFRLTSLTVGGYAFVIYGDGLTFGVYFSDNKTFKIRIQGVEESYDYEYSRVFTLDDLLTTFILGIEQTSTSLRMSINGNVETFALVEPAFFSALNEPFDIYLGYEFNGDLQMVIWENAGVVTLNLFNASDLSAANVVDHVGSLNIPVIDGVWSAT